MINPPFRKGDFALPKRGSVLCGFVHTMRNLGKWPGNHAVLAYVRKDGTTVAEYLINPSLTEELGAFVECPTAHAVRLADQKARNREMRAQVAEWAHENREDIEIERDIERYWMRTRAELINKIQRMVDEFNSKTPYEEIYEAYH